MEKFAKCMKKLKKVKFQNSTPGAPAQLWVGGILKI